MLNLLPLVLALPAAPGLAPLALGQPHDDGAVQEAQEIQAERLFPLASGNLVFDPDASLESLAIEYARLTGQSMIVSDEASTFLSSGRVSLSPMISVAPDRVQSTFERVMIDNGFAMHVASSAEPRIFSLSSIHTSGRSTMRSKAIYVESDNLAMLAEHPAVLFTTSVHLPHVDVRQMGNSMRTMITDSNLQQLLPAGASNSMIVTGFGPHVTKIVRVLRKANHEAGLENKKRAQASKLLIERFDLRNAVASECPDKLAGILGPEGAETPTLPEGSRVVADVRTNALIVRANAAQMEDFRRAIMLLDGKE